MRYQAATSSNTHRFFCGSTQGLSVGASSSTFAGTLNATNFTATGTLTTPAITLNGTSLSTTLDGKADKDNTKLTGNIGINTTTPDSALHIVGTKVDNPSRAGTRMGKSSSFATGATDSYGIELCSDTAFSGGSYIDFTYPLGG